jgi:hypothetical protein
MKRLVSAGVFFLFAACILCAGCSTSKDSSKGEPESALRTGPYLGQTPPGAEPELFAPGFVSTGLYERDVALTPDGAEFYFGLISGRVVTIAMVRMVNGVWSKQEIAPFCSDPGTYNLEPHITPDGRKFLFLSTRPKGGQPPQSGWTYQDIWAMDRIENGWSEPYNLGPPVDTDAPEYYPSVTRDGSLYFTREVNTTEGRRSFILRSRLSEGSYDEPYVLPIQVNPGEQQFNAFIDPDERYIIFGAAGLPSNIGRTDYYVAFHNDDDTWVGPINMGKLINTPGNNVTSPYVSRDGRYFFFASSRTAQEQPGQKLDYEAIQRLSTMPQNGNADIYWMDASFIETLRPQAAAPSGDAD